MKYFGLENRQQIAVGWELNQNKTIYEKHWLSDLGFPAWKESIKDETLKVEDPDSVFSKGWDLAVLGGTYLGSYPLITVSQKLVDTINSELKEAFWLIALEKEEAVFHEFVALKEKEIRTRTFQNEKYEEMTEPVYASLKYAIILREDIYNKIKHLDFEKCHWNEVK